MAVPKNKTSHARKNKRRASNSKLPVVNLSTCKQCGELMRPHNVCKKCGHYNGREIISC